MSDETVTEEKKGSTCANIGAAIEVCLVLGIGAIILALIIGFIVWQLILLGQLVGVIIGLITFISLLVFLSLHFRVDTKGDNPSLAFKLKVFTTILFVAFLVEAIFTFRFFCTPIFYPIISQFFSAANWSVGGGEVLIITIILFIIVIALYFSIPLALWTNLCKSSKDTPELPPGETPVLQKEEEAKPLENCPTCGAKLKGYEKFCINCGAAIGPS